MITIKVILIKNPFNCHVFSLFVSFQYADADDDGKSEKERHMKRRGSETADDDDGGGEKEERERKIRDAQLIVEYSPSPAP